MLIRIALFTTGFQNSSFYLLNYIPEHDSGTDQQFEVFSPTTRDLIARKSNPVC